jgi:hypothetical protein
MEVAAFNHNINYLILLQNHAVRKVDLGRRIVETVYPVSNKSSGILSWIIDKLSLKKEVARTILDFDADLVALPWHLIQISEDSLLVADRKYATVLNLSIYLLRCQFDCHVFDIMIYHAHLFILPELTPTFSVGYIR